MRITAVELQTANLGDQLEFWGEALSLPMHGTAIEVGKTTVTFVPVEEPPPVAHLAINVPENLIEEARDWIAARTPVLLHNGEEITDFSFWNAHSVYFADPDGNVLELIARHGLENPSPGPFGPEAFLEVSEVGLQTADVGAAATWLEDELGLPFYSGDRRGFAAIGDEHGLFIVVPDGRPWVPTDTPAHPHPTTLTIAGGPPGEHALPGSPYRIVCG